MFLLRRALLSSLVERLLPLLDGGVKLLWSDPLEKFSLPVGLIGMTFICCDLGFLFIIKRDILCV